MTLLEWKPEYCIGDVAIDYEHEQMFRQINSLYNQLDDPVDVEAIAAVLAEIHSDISAHFALEELLMRQAGYVEYADHKDDHEDLLDQITELMDSFDVNPAEGQKLLELQLSDWFGRHFSTYDARLHQQLG